MDDLERIAGGLAAAIGRAVAIDDPQMVLVTHTAHDEQVDRYRIQSVMTRRGPDEVVQHAFAHGIATADGPVRIPAVPDIDLYERVCVPVRCEGLLLGYLWIIDADRTLTEPQLQRAVDAAADAGQVMYRQQLLSDLRDSRERDLLRDLLTDDADVRAAAAALLQDEEILPPAPSVCVLAVQVEAPGSPSEGVRTGLDLALRTVARRADPLVCLSLSRAGGRGVVLVAGRRPLPPAELRRLAESLREDLARRVGAPATVLVGIGPVVSGADAAAGSADRAQEALEVARAVSGHGPVTAWDELGVFRLLVKLPLDDLSADAVPPGLRTLMDADREGVLVETLETWFDEACDPRATVARLQVHRTSLYYRLGRIEEITGLSLSDGSTRLDLHLGLKLARLKGLLDSRRAHGR